MRELASVPSILLICNPRSGGAQGEQESKKLEKILGSNGDRIRVMCPANGDELKAAAAEAAQSPEEVVVATGGDGTVSLIAGHLCDTGKKLGVIPGGTLNHFSKDLGIPQELEQAARSVLDGRTILVDVAELNGRVFVNNSSLGLYPEFVRFRESDQEMIGNKWLAAIPALVRAMLRGGSLRAEITADAQYLVRRSSLIFIGNNAYCTEGLELGSRKRLDEGKLCLFTTRKPGRFHLLQLMLGSVLGSVLGRRHAAEDLDQLEAKEIVIASRRHRLPVALDGEIVDMSPPLNYSIRPRALKVIVPRETVP
jgi:diacylglycerol kinase family enzyme